MTFVRNSRSQSTAARRPQPAARTLFVLALAGVSACLPTAAEARQQVTVQRDGERLLEQVPEIDALFGVHNRDDVAAAVWGTRRRPVDLHLGGYYAQTWSDRGRLRLTPRHYAYVRICEGCDQTCTFCTIPAIRGPGGARSIQ